MWKIKDPELKRKMNQFISDEGINQLCKKQMKGISKCIFFFEDSGVSIRRTDVTSFRFNPHRSAALNEQIKTQSIRFPGALFLDKARIL